MVDIGGLADLTITVGGDLAPLQDSLNQVPQMVQQVAGQVNTALDSMGSSGTGTGEMFQRLTDAVNALSVGLGQMVGSAKDADAELQNKQKDAGDAADAFDKMGQSLKDAGGALVLVGAALTGVTAGMVDVASSALDVAGNFERVHITLGVLMGSAADATAEMSKLVEFANNSGQAIDTMFKGFQNMLARGFDTSKANEAIQSLTAAASAFNIPMDQMIRSFDSLQTRGTAALQQMARAGIPVWQMLADAADTSIAEIRAIVQRGGLDAQAAMDTLLDVIKQRYGAIPAQIAQSFSGLKQEVANQVELALNALGQALLPVAKQVAGVIITVVQALQQAAEWFGKLPVPIQDIAIGLGVLAAAVGPLVLALGGFLFTLGQIMIAFPALAEGLSAVLPAAMVKTGTAATAAAAEVEGAGAAMTATAAAATEASFAFGAFAVSVSAIVGYALGSWLRDNIPAVRELGDAIGDLILKIPGVEQLVNAIAGVPKAIGSFETTLVPTIIRLQQKLADVGITVQQGTMSTQEYANALSKAAIQAGLFADAGTKVKATMDLADQAANKLHDSQQQANDALQRARDVLELVQTQVKMGVAGNSELTTAMNAVTAAYNKANPVLKGATAKVNLQANAAQSLGKTWLSFLTIAEKIPSDMASLKTAIIDGMNVDGIVKSLDQFIQKLTDLGADADKNLGMVRDSAIDARKNFINMLQSLDPAAMQSFVKNGVEVLKGGLDTAGMSAQQMGAALAKSMNISQDAADKLVKAWQVGMRDAGAATDGFTTKIVNGVQMIQPFTDAVVRHGHAASEAASNTRDLSAAFDLMNQTSQISAGNFGKVTLGVQQLISAQANLNNNAVVAKQVFDDVNARYQQGSVSVQVLQHALENYVQAVKSAIGPNQDAATAMQNMVNVSPDLQKALEGVAQAESDAGSAASSMASKMGDANSAMQDFFSAADKGASGLTDALNGTTTSAAGFLLNLKAMQADPALAGDIMVPPEAIDNALNNLGFTGSGAGTGGTFFSPGAGPQFTTSSGGNRSTSSAGGGSPAAALAAVATSGQQASQSLTQIYNNGLAAANAIGLTGDAAKSYAEQQVKWAQQANGAYSALATTTSTLNSQFVTLADGTKTYASIVSALNPLYGGFLPVMTALSSSTSDAATAMGDLAPAIANATSAIATVTASTVNYSAAQVDSGTVYGQTMKNLMSLGQNFYDAAQESANLLQVSDRTGQAIDALGQAAVNAAGALGSVASIGGTPANPNQGLIDAWNAAHPDQPYVPPNATTGPVSNPNQALIDAWNAAHPDLGYNPPQATINPNGFGPGRAGTTSAGTGLGLGPTNGTNFGDMSVPSNQSFTVDLSNSTFVGTGGVTQLTNTIMQEFAKLMRTTAGQKL